MIPAIISQCVVAVKDTSLILIVFGVGLTTIAKQTAAVVPEHRAHDAGRRSAVYVVINLALMRARHLVQRKFVVEKKVLQVSMVGRRRYRRSTRPSEPYFFGVTQSLMTPSITTTPSSRSPRTRTWRSGSSLVHCSGSVSAMQVMSRSPSPCRRCPCPWGSSACRSGCSPRPALPSRPRARCTARSRARFQVVVHAAALGDDELDVIGLDHREPRADRGEVGRLLRERDRRTRACPRPGWRHWCSTASGSGSCADVTSR